MNLTKNYIFKRTKKANEENIMNCSTEDKLNCNTEELNCGDKNCGDMNCGDIKDTVASNNIILKRLATPKVYTLTRIY